MSFLQRLRFIAIFRNLLNKKGIEPLMGSLWLPSSCFPFTQRLSCRPPSFPGGARPKPAAAVMSPCALPNPKPNPSHRLNRFYVPLAGPRGPASPYGARLSRRPGDGRDAGRCPVVSSPSLASPRSSEGCLGLAGASSAKMLSALQTHHGKIAREPSGGRAGPRQELGAHPSPCAAAGRL